LQEKSEMHRCYHRVEASCLVPGAANKQKKNYSGFHQLVVDGLGLLRRHATLAHLNAWRKGKQLRETTLISLKFSGRICLGFYNF